MSGDGHWLAEQARAAMAAGEQIVPPAGEAQLQDVQITFVFHGDDAQAKEFADEVTAAIARHDQVGIVTASMIGRAA